ncbi:MAG: tol-pal system-associated acyl-CoA thioesterase [Pseudomonadota bacterium]
MKYFSWPVRVYYEDTDSGGIVYYANYLKFFERARTEWLRSFGLNQDKLEKEAGLIFVVRRALLDFDRPARLDDMLEVTVEPRKLARVYVDLVQQARRGEERLARAEVRVACLDKNDLKPALMPPVLRRIAGSARVKAGIPLLWK